MASIRRMQWLLSGLCGVPQPYFHPSACPAGPIENLQPVTATAWKIPSPQLDAVNSADLWMARVQAHSRYTLQRENLTPGWTFSTAAIAGLREGAADRQQRHM